MKKQYGIDVSDSVSNLDYTSVNEGLQGVEHIIKEFPQAKDSFTSIGVSKSGLMCAGYDGDINFNQVILLQGKKHWLHMETQPFIQREIISLVQVVMKLGIYLKKHLFQRIVIQCLE